MAKTSTPVRQQAEELQARLQQYRIWWMMFLLARKKDLEADLRATGGQVPTPGGASAQEGIDGL